MKQVLLERFPTALNSFSKNRAVIVKGVITPGHDELLSQVEDAGSAIKEAKDHFEQHSELGVVSRQSLVKIMNKVYEQHGVVCDHDAVAQWLDVSLASLGARKVDPVLSWVEFQVFFACIIVFARSKKQHRIKRASVMGAASRFDKHVFL